MTLIVAVAFSRRILNHFSVRVVAPSRDEEDSPKLAGVRTDVVSQALATLTFVDTNHRLIEGNNSGQQCN